MILSTLATGNTQSTLFGSPKFRFGNFWSYVVVYEFLQLGTVSEGLQLSFDDAHLLDCVDQKQRTTLSVSNEETTPGLRCLGVSRWRQ